MVHAGEVADQADRTEPLFTFHTAQWLAPSGERLAGSSETDIITVQTRHPAAYVGIERFEGTLHGRKGGFVLQHNAGGTDGVPWMTWKIVETSGTGDLAGIRGEGQIIIGADGGHSYTLDYEL